MPLPPTSAERTLLHTRTITCQGFERADGLWEIDGWLTDVKSYSFPNHDRGEIKAGEPLHGMGLRLTIDQSLTVQDAVAVMDFSPFRICPNITPSFRKLIGLKLTKGFNRSVRELLGGTAGCTHLVDLLGPMATTLYQTSAGARGKKLRQAFGSGDEGRRPPLIDSCHAWAATGEAVKRTFPDHYAGSDKKLSS
jgi:hypothetical protein